MATPKPQPTSWIPGAPVIIERDILIPASTETVWEHFADNEGWVHWFPGCKVCHFVGDPPHGAGSKRFVHMDQFRVTEEITAWEPGKRWGLTVIEINAPIMSAMAEEAVLTTEPDGTRVTFKIGVELRGVGKLLRAPLVAKQSKALETALQNLSKRADA